MSWLAASAAHAAAALPSIREAGSRSKAVPHVRSKPCSKINPSDFTPYASLLPSVETPSTAAQQTFQNDVQQTVQQTERTR